MLEMDFQGLGNVTLYSLCYGKVYAFKLIWIDYLRILKWNEALSWSIESANYNQNVTLFTYQRDYIHQLFHLWYVQMSTMKIIRLGIPKLSVFHSLFHPKELMLYVEYIYWYELQNIL